MSDLNSIAHKKKFSIDVNATIVDAMATMLGNRDGSVVLLDNGYPVAILTEGLLLKLFEENTDLTQPAKSIASSPVITVHENRPVESAFDLIISNNIRRLVLVDNDGKYRGMVLQEDLLCFIDKDLYKIDLKVADLLVPDSRVISVVMGTNLYDVLVQMRHSKVGSVIVTDASSKVVGIVTEKDILTAGYHGIELAQAVETLMSFPVLSVNMEDAITEVIVLMRNTDIRRVLVCESNGNMCALLTNRDIFKHVKGNVARMLEIKLRHAQEIMDLLPEPIIEIYDDVNHQIIHWINHKAKEYFGDALLEESPEILFGDSWKDLYEVLKKNGHIEYFSTVLDGRNFEFSGTLSININSRYIKLIAKDVTEHEMMKQQLQDEIREEIQLRQDQEYLMMQQSRLASMGEMIGHIAHQWRQPLAQLGGIFMNLESAHAFNELNETYLKDKIINGNETIKYMSQTIDDFRLFFTPNENIERFDVVVVLLQAISIVSAGLDYHHIDVNIDGNPEEFFAKASASEFAQVILNLLINAKDALSETSDYDRDIVISLKKEEDKILLCFSDNGGGIDPNILSDIFKPYVSTKHKTGGTGMGLYISHLIMEQKMKGSICAQNDDNGAYFTLSFPSA
ncbi:MAG: CBS domain-containing protein [Campylobacterota bacterium]|nr:CBS domain-containing protein [Campylobacterota bacterium]